jgi:putative lipoic acid-binding regulatory protein
MNTKMSAISSSTTPEGESLIVYPSDFPIKIMGRNADGFAETMAALVRDHAPDFDPASMELRPSSGRNYLSCTCTIRATSRAQLDALYLALSSHPMVAVVL